MQPVTKSLLRAIFAQVRIGFTLEYACHLITNMVLVSLVTPTLIYTSYNELYAGNTHQGIIYLVVIALVDSIELFHYRRWILPFTKKNDALIAEQFEHTVISKEMKIDWAKLRKLKTDGVERICGDAKWRLNDFSKSLVTKFLKLIPLVVYCYFLTALSPLSALIYCVAIGLAIYLIPENTEKHDILGNMRKLWIVYHHAQNSVLRSVIHNNEDSLDEVMSGLIRQLDGHQSERTDDKLTDAIKHVFNLAQVLNHLLIGYQDPGAAVIMLYLQYTGNIKGYLLQLCTIKEEFNGLHRVYTDLYDKLLSLDNLPPMPHQVRINKQLEVKSLRFVEETRQINLLDPFTWSPGYIVQIMGESGHGKSTLMDIITGVLRDYTGEILVDGYTMPDNFCNLLVNRLYVEQVEMPIGRTSIYNFVTNTFDLPVPQELADKNTERLVYQALTMAGCDSFINGVDGKNIYATDCEMSVGEKGRITVAATCYKLLLSVETGKPPDLVILDEIDKAVQPELAVWILQNIFALCKKYGIICVITAHTTEAKQLDCFDSVLHLEKGYITVRK